MAVTQETSLYGVVGQPLTQDYLARQLPIFQEKVPIYQPKPQFPTNAPPNLPLPPLYPGELIKLQEHRVICTDTFSEPAVGAIYITNYRLIFYGNLISDPESIDDLNETNRKLQNKKEMSESSVSILPSKMKSSKGEPSFKSFLMGGDPDASRETHRQPAVTRSHTQKLKSGLRKIGSLRLSPRNRGKLALPDDFTDGAAAIGPPETQVIGKGNIEARPGLCPLAELTEVSIDTKSKRKDIILNYRQETVSLDSVSVSSTSEFSVTGTDDRNTSSPVNDEGNTLLVDILSSREQRVCLTENERTIGFPDPLSSSGWVNDTTLEASTNSRLTVDSEITLGTSCSSFTSRNPTLQTGKGSSLHAQSNQVLPGYRNDFFASLQPALKLVKPMPEKVHSIWKNSIVQPESDSDGESDNIVTSTRKNNHSKLCLDASGSLENGINSNKLKPTESETNIKTDKNSVLPFTDFQTASSAQPTSNGTTDDMHYPTLPLLNHNHLERSSKEVRVDSSMNSVKNGKHPYANLKLLTSKSASVFSLASKPFIRKRSNSNSPITRKKPKPLPRMSIKKKNSKEIKQELFLSSVPADFKPTPLPRVRSSNSSQEQRATPNSLNLPGLFKCRDSLQQDSSSPSKSVGPLQQVSSLPSSPFDGTSSQSTLLCGSSNTSSPSVSNQSSDLEFSCGDSNPVPPPRRKHKSRSRPMWTSADTLHKVAVLPVSPEEELFPNQDHLSKSCELSHDQHDSELIPTVTVDNLSREDLSSNKSHDLDGSESSRSHDLTDDDILNSPLHKETSKIGDTLDHNTRQSVGSSVCTSYTSLAVFTDSNSGISSSLTLRPLSLFSPSDTIFQFNLHGSCERSYDFSSGHTLPKTITWSGQEQSNRKSDKLLAPASTRYSLCVSFPLRSIHSVRKLTSVSLKEYGLKLPDGLLLLCRNFHSIRLHIHPHNTYDSDGLKELLERKFITETPLYELFAFHYRGAIRHSNPTFLQNRSLPNHFSLSDEMSRLGLQDSKLWTVTRVLVQYPELCSSYPTHVIVPISTGDLDYIRGAKQYHEGRFPTLTWYNKTNGAALIRAANTKDERGHSSSNLQIDEALLQSISGSKLDPNGPPTMVHIYTDMPESGVNVRSAEQVRTYHYHHCKFNYTNNPPTFRNVRHSFNKLQAMLENNIPDEDYLLALDTTHWLPRVGELLSTAYSICHTLINEGTHVIVCYESGWDRTTQIVSLAQLLMDPYYRTMDGFQVLVQKEWVWFGHPFQVRHSRTGKSKEDGPMFLQWMDCVWQVMHQSPSAFEFNENLLISMVEHSYSGLFGTFMTSSERARRQYFSEKGHEHKSVSSHTISYWTWVSMTNAAGHTFYNNLYDPNTYKGLITPRWAVPSLRLWTSHYCRYKPEENTTQNLPLHIHLEELLRNYKKLLASSTTFCWPLPTTKDELYIAGKDGLRREKPVPPPKPVLKYKYESLEEFLVQEGFDPSICMHLELRPTTCQGSLIKLGAKRKNWLQRWFVLDFNCQYFAYFENQSAYANKENPKGVIRLSDINRVFQEVKKKDHLMKNIFMLETPHRTYQMQAPSITAMYIWIACLELPVSALKLGTS